MKRDMELIRELLLRIEADDDIPDADAIGVVEYVRDYHLQLLLEAGLAAGFVAAPVLSGEFVIQGTPTPRLTWEGHEFLDVARDPSTWEKAKATLAGAGKDLGSVTIGVLQSLLARIAAASMGIP